jgi:hypothetical protein
MEFHKIPKKFHGIILHLVNEYKKLLFYKFYKYKNLTP